jgi:hypothetical protein
VKPGKVDMTRMRRVWAAGCVALAVASCVGLALAAPKKTVRAALVPEAPQELMIPLGRVQIFGEQQQQAMADLKESVDDDSRNPNSLYGKLFVAIWIHNVNVQRACEEKIVSRKLCRTSRYRPWWLKEPGTVVYSYKSMLRFVEEAQTAMTPFWSDLCARAAKEKKENLNEYCPME